MTNVLPEISKREIWSAYRARFILAGSAVALVVALIAFLALLPGYLALHAVESVVVQPSSSSSNTETRVDITRAQALLTVLKPLVAATTTPLQIVSAALELRPKGVKVERITYAPGTIVLAGSAPSRESISAYKNALAADPHFTSASVPVGDLTGASGGKFSVTLSGAF